MLGIVKADGRKIPLGDESVQCVVTSPPYWGLRKYAGEQELVWGGREDCEHSWENESLDVYDNKKGQHWQAAYGGQKGQNRFGYGNTDKARQVKSQSVVRGICSLCGAWRGAYGLEPTVNSYVAHTVEILREIRRVLRDDGVVFWNSGDSYASSGKTGLDIYSDKSTLCGGMVTAENAAWKRNRPEMKLSPGLKPKDLCLIPFRVALAAQADGWWVRSDIIWAKPNPMPESVTDRPTRSHEYILMLTKSASYYWDAEAVMESSSQPSRKRSDLVGGSSWQEREQHSEGGNFSGATHRNLRSVWTFTTEAYPEAHFAVFPEELPRRCILAATSFKGACAKCGTAWERVADRSVHPHPNRWSKINDGKQFSQEGNNYGPGGTLGVAHQSTTVGWHPGCACGGYRVRSVHSKRLSRHSWYRNHWQARIESKWPRVVACLTLDPFAGSGTVGKVAIELGRRAILCDLAYQDLASKRTAAIQRPLIAPAEAWRE